MTISSHKSATTGLSAQNKIVQHLLTWRTNPIGLNILQNLNLPIALETISSIKNKPVSTDEKIDCAFQIFFKQKESNHKLECPIDHLSTDHLSIQIAQNNDKQEPLSSGKIQNNEYCHQTQSIDVLISNKNVLYPEYVFVFNSEPQNEQINKNESQPNTHEHCHSLTELKLWEQFWRQHFLNFQISTHPTHHVGRINFKKAIEYALFDSINLDVNSAILSHFVDGQSLAFQDDSTKNKVLAHLNIQKNKLLSNNLLGLANLAHPTHLGITLSAYHSTMHSLTKMPNEIFLQNQQIYHLLQNIILQITNEPNFSFDSAIDNNLYLKSAYNIFNEIVFNKKSKVFFVEKLITEINIKNNNQSSSSDGKINLQDYSNDSNIFLFLYSALQGSALILNSQHKTKLQPNNEKDTEIFAFYSMKMPQALDILQTLDVNVSIPQSTQIGLIGNPLWHLQCGKSLSSGPQTDAQMKINVLLLLFLNLFHK